MSDQGKANYEGYRAAVQAPMPKWDELSHQAKHAYDAGADAVEAWLADAPVDEDAPGNETEAPKVIVVTDATGGVRRYALPAFGELRNGELVIGRHLPDDSDADPGQKIEVDVMYPAGQWTRVHKDGAEVPDATDRALHIAKRALSEIVKRSDDGGEQPFGRPEIGGIASTALNDIWTETEG